MPLAGPRAYFFERDEELRPREREELLDLLLDLRVPDVRERLRDELPDLRPVRPLAVVRVRVLAPPLRVLRVGFARRVELFEELFDELFASPVLLRCLFTVRAAISFARFVLVPRLRADCLIFSY